MNGIEKITAKITQDADAEAARILADAEAKAREILTEAQTQAEKISADLSVKGRKAAEERRERLKSAAGMERRKILLAAKQEVLGEVFDLALEKLCSLPEEEYIALLTALALEASTSGKEQLVFSIKDRARIGKQVVIAANEAMVSQVVPDLPDAIADSKVGAFLGKVVNSAAAQISGTGLLTLSQETRNIKGGFIMVDGAVEMNCAFETLVRLQREKLEKQVADVLFED